MSIRISSFASLLKKQAVEMPKQVRKGLREGVRRGQALLVRKTPTYRSEMRQEWAKPSSLQDTRGGITLHNSAPHAGVVERGARPHGVSPEGREEIETWFVRQVGLNPIEAKAAAAGYIEKLKREGQEGLFIVEKALDQLRNYTQQEIQRLIFAGVKP